MPGYENEYLPQWARDVLARPDLTGDEKIAEVMLRHHRGKNTKAWPSVGTLAKETGRKRTNVQRTLRRLESKGRIAERTRRPGHSSEYMLPDREPQIDTPPASKRGTPPPQIDTQKLTTRSNKFKKPPTRARAPAREAPVSKPSTGLVEVEWSYLKFTPQELQDFPELVAELPSRSDAIARLENAASTCERQGVRNRVRWLLAALKDNPKAWEHPLAAITDEDVAAEQAHQAPDKGPIKVEHESWVTARIGELVGIDDAQVLEDWCRHHGPYALGIGSKNIRHRLTIALFASAERSQVDRDIATGWLRGCLKAEVLQANIGALIGSLEAGVYVEPLPEPSTMAATPAPEPLEPETTHQDHDLLEAPSEALTGEDEYPDPEGWERPWNADEEEDPWARNAAS